MQQLRDGYRGIAVLIELNADLLLFVATLCGALAVVGYLTTF